MAEGYNEIKPDAVYFNNKKDFLSRWRDYLQPGDTVLVKASNGMGFNDIVRGLSE
jgi:UDP-N-acetylmuramyl pentapeptide synthase